MATVQGIGGVFIDSNDAARLARWYAETFGIAMEAHPEGTGHYHVFATRDAETSVLRENPVFAINQATVPLATTGRGFVLNLRVDDLDAMLAHLRTLDVPIDERIIVWERGKHAWIHDPDGNRIELYEELLADTSA